jgi:hypothetical protein
VASGVYDCATSVDDPSDDSLEHWDTLADTPVDAVSAGPTQASASAPASLSGPTDTNIPIERQIIGLPSNNNVTPGHADTELILRKTQAKTHLNHLRELIAEKSFQYSDLIRPAPRKGVVTRARSALKNITQRILFHSQVYTRCRQRLLYLGADATTLQRFRELKKEDIKASTAILTPNISGSTTLKLSWIWHDVAHHILPHADADVSNNPAAMLECISSYSFNDLCTHQFSVRRVHWLRARAQMNRWTEECTLVKYEMEWTVRYFMYKSRLWPSAPMSLAAGPAAYARRKAVMWDHMARDADRSFRSINANYKSPL